MFTSKKIKLGSKPMSIEYMPESSEDFKALFVEWLKEAAIHATEKGSKAAILYNRALDKVRKCSHPIQDKKALKLIPYVGDKTVKYLIEKLDIHCRHNNIDLPRGFSEHQESNVPVTKRKQSTLDGELLEEPKKKKKRQRKQYIPKKRSGSYAILLALYFEDRRRRGMRKDDIIRHATPYSDKSFRPNPSVQDFYSAWNSMKSLIAHDLVDCISRNPKIYTLTDEGFQLARQLNIADGVHSSPSTRELDLSFDNNLRVTPDNSMLSSNLPSSPSRMALNSMRGSSSHLFMPSSICSSPISRSTFSSNNLKTSENHDGTCDSPSSLEKRGRKRDLSEHDVQNKVYRGVKYDVWAHDEYDIIVLIDNREIRSKQERDFFQNRLSSLNVICDVRLLSLGDIVWIAKHKTTQKEVLLNVICERKRIDDLVSSIRDGRFHEQKGRLRRSGMKYFYYLIEEVSTARFDVSSSTIESIRTSMSLIMTVSNFFLRKFKNIEDTINFISSLTEVIKEKLASDKSRLLVLRPINIKNQRDYTEMLDTFRKKFEQRKTSYECVHLFSTFQDTMGKTGQLTLKEMFIQMLMVIKGVSLERAIRIQRYFQTPSSFIKFFLEENAHLSEDQKRLLLTSLFKNEVGNKKIGKVLLERIYLNWGSKNQELNSSVLK